MKTTVEIADPLFEQVRALAARDGLTLRNLIETGLRLALQHQRPRSAFALRDARFGGRGLKHEFRDGSWHSIRSAAHPEPRS